MFLNSAKFYKSTPLILTTQKFVNSLQTKEKLQFVVDAWIANSSTATSTYGDINTWDVSDITDMSELFKDKTTFNSDISNWDVSSVTNMSSMFNGASSFTINISGWDVSNVTNFLIAGADPGSKFTKAKELNVNIITEQELLEML